MYTCIHIYTYMHIWQIHLGAAQTFIPSKQVRSGPEEHAKVCEAGLNLSSSGNETGYIYIYLISYLNYTMIGGVHMHIHIHVYMYIYICTYMHMNAYIRRYIEYLILLEAQLLILLPGCTTLPGTAERPFPSIEGSTRRQSQVEGAPRCCERRVCLRGYLKPSMQVRYLTQIFLIRKMTIDEPWDFQGTVQTKPMGNSRIRVRC